MTPRSSSRMAFPLPLCKRRERVFARCCSPRPNVRFAPPVVALQARVALGDEIAARQGAALAVVLIGERPGLSSCDSVGAYLTFAPQPGTTKDAGRNCVSNIRADGLSLEEASRRILAIMALARTIRRTGTALKEDEALEVLPPQQA